MLKEEDIRVPSKEDLKIIGEEEIDECSHLGKFGKWEEVDRDINETGGEGYIIQERECKYCGFKEMRRQIF